MPDSFSKYLYSAALSILIPAATAVDVHQNLINFRVEFLRNNGSWNPPNPNDTYVDFENIEFEIYAPQESTHEYEVEEDNGEITGEKKKELRDNLMKLQNIIEEDVKEKVVEGTYLKIMDNLKHFYDLLR